MFIKCSTKQKIVEIDDHNYNTKCPLRDSPLRDTSYYHLLLSGQYKRVERAFLFMHFYC